MQKAKFVDDLLGRLEDSRASICGLLNSLRCLGEASFACKPFRAFQGPDLVWGKVGGCVCLGLASQGVCRVTGSGSITEIENLMGEFHGRDGVIRFDQSELRHNEEAP